jgi:cytochrome c-type biogenesis protein CcmF
MLEWKRGDLPGALARLQFALIAAVAVMILTWLVAGGSAETIWAGGALGLAAWLFVSTLIAFGERIFLFRTRFSAAMRRMRKLPRNVHGAALAHIGVAVLIVGITGSTAWKVEKIQTMRVGDTADVAGYTLTLKKIENDVQGPNYTARRATFIATRGGDFVAELKPEQRLYDTPPLPTTFAAIHTNLLGDIYAVIGDASGKGYITRLYYNPLVPWIFIGAFLAFAGGALALSERLPRMRILKKLKKKS